MNSGTPTEDLQVLLTDLLNLLEQARGVAVKAKGAIITSLHDDSVAVSLDEHKLRDIARRSPRPPDILRVTDPAERKRMVEDWLEVAKLFRQELEAELPGIHAGPVSEIASIEDDIRILATRILRLRDS